MSGHWDAVLSTEQERDERKDRREDPGPAGKVVVLGGRRRNALVETVAGAPGLSVHVAGAH